MALDPNEFYRTDDMALVTFFKLEGHAPQHVTWEGEFCYWYFRVTDRLLDLAEEFAEGKARVDPKVYNREFGRTKREFYDSKLSA